MWAAPQRLFRYLPDPEDGAQPGGPSDPGESPLPTGGLSLRPAARDPPQSSALCLGGCGEASTERQAAERVVGGLAVRMALPPHTARRSRRSRVGQGPWEAWASTPCSH